MLLVLPAFPAAGHVPGAGKITDAVAERNREDGRDQLLAVRVALRGADGEIEALGQLLMDPAGRARLELRDRLGHAERHLVLSGRYGASRDGAPLAEPRVLLAPLYVIQAGSASRLRGALREIGADPERVTLGHTELDDCYVLGGRDLPARASGGRGGRPALWVELQHFEPVAIDWGERGRFQLGPLTSHKEIRLPAWIAIERPGDAPLRLELRDPEPAAPEPGAFDPAWLRSP